MNSKIPLILLGAATISASSFAETLTYNRSPTGSFYDGAYWDGKVPSETSDIVFDDTAKATKYDLDATKGVTVNSITDNSIIDKTLEGDARWGNYIKINIVRRKRVVCSGVVQEYSVVPGHREHHRIRRALTFCHAQVLPSTAQLAQHAAY